MHTAAGVHVTVWGDGEPAVLVHGSFGWGEETWREQRPLADDYQLLLIDRRGFGSSQSDGRVDFERDADDVADLLGDGAHLVGHSYGGVVSLLICICLPIASCPGQSTLAIAWLTIITRTEPRRSSAVKPRPRRIRVPIVAK